MEHIEQQPGDTTPTAHEAVGKQFGVKQLGVLRVNELAPVYAYSASLEYRIQQLKLTGEMEDGGQSFEQWRNRYHEYPIPDEQNKRHWWQ